MKKSFFILATWLAFGLSRALALDASEIQTRVEDLLSRMTLEEKVGQMTQITLNAVSEGVLPYDIKEPHQLDEERLREAIVGRNVGSIFNTCQHAFSPEYWREIIAKIQGIATTETRLKIPVLYAVDAVHGTHYTYRSTLFPHQIGLAATWNPDLVEEVAKITAYELRAIGIPWNLSPTVDVGRSVLHSRFYETFGEDVLLTKTLGRAMVRGYQGQTLSDPKRVAATLKHFIGYTMPLTGKDRTSAWIPEHYLREVFLPPFIDCIHAGARIVMLNLSEINGIPVHADAHLVNDLLRKELMFDGVVVSDWESVQEVFYHHHVAEDHQEAVRLSVLAGLDMSMVPFDFSFAEHLLDLVRRGRVPVSRIDESVRRIIRLKYELGLFDDTEAKDHPLFGSEEFKRVSHQAALESITLLKNRRGTLPLSKRARVLVTGFGADSMAALNGGWTYTWQGAGTDPHVKDRQTILKAIQAKIGNKRVRHVETEPNTLYNIAKAGKVAKEVDCVILCLGETPYAEIFGNLGDLALSKAQIRLAKEVAASGRPVILVLLEGRPRIIAEIEPLMSAILTAYLPSNEGGKAIAQILFGEANPSGRLPFTYPKGPNSLIPYDHKYSEIYVADVQYPFGFGLSYTTFRYSNLHLSLDALGPLDTLTISVDVTNTGRRTGEEVVQLYIGDLFASLAPPVKRLRGFQKIALRPQETKTVSLLIRPEDLAFVDRTHHWVVEKGEFDVSLGPFKKRFFLREGMVWPSKG